MYLDGPDYEKYVAATYRKETRADRTPEAQRADGQGLMAMAAPASPLIRLHANDNVLIARQALALGQELPEFDLRLRAQVPAGHKIAARRIAAGEAVRKYDTVIGAALRDIEAGEHVHTHNLTLGGLRPRPRLLRRRAAGRLCARSRARHLHGHRARRRPRGHAQLHRPAVVGELLGHGHQAHRRRISRRERLAAFPNVDGVVAFAQTQRLRHGHRPASTSTCCAARWPATRGIANLAGVLIVGLGCERNQVAELVESQGLERAAHRCARWSCRTPAARARPSRPASRRSKRCCPRPTRVKRVPVSASHLKVGLECGGSDGFSGITANPALGAAMDILVRHGGTAILSETPEIHGVEYMLTRRAVTPRGRPEAARAHGLVGGIHARPQRPVQRRGRPRQPGRRPGQHLREVAGLGDEGRHHAADGGLRVRRADRQGRLRVHGLAGLRPGARPPARSPAAPT